MRATLRTALCFSVFVASPCLASFMEASPNETIGQANLITRGSPSWSDVGVLTLDSTNDVDFFAINLNAGETFTAITTPMSIMFTAPDTLMALFLSDGTQLVFDDNLGSGLGSAIQFAASQTGVYYLGVTGAGDPEFDGSHSTGIYSLTLSIVELPEPATVALVALGVLGLVRKPR